MTASDTSFHSTPSLADHRGLSFVLASGSARRIELLRALGFDPIVEPADLDDGALEIGAVSARDAATALAHFKARRVAEQRQARGAEVAWILAADTVCELDGAILGKPRDEAHARSMLRSLEARRHAVVTGWCLLGPDGSCRVGRDEAWIVMGALDAEDFERFLSEGAWRGKAGSYNLPEVVARGWPVSCEGDPQTVVGLPAEKLAPMLRAALARRGVSSRVEDDA